MRAPRVEKDLTITTPRSSRSGGEEDEEYEEVISMEDEKVLVSYIAIGESVDSLKKYIFTNTACQQRFYCKLSLCQGSRGEERARLRLRCLRQGRPQAVLCQDHLSGGVPGTALRGEGTCAILYFFPNSKTTTCNRYTRV